MQRPALVLVSTILLAIVGLASPHRASAQGHFGLSFHGPRFGFGIGFRGYRYHPGPYYRHYRPYGYRYYGGYPFYYGPSAYVSAYPSVTPSVVYVSHARSSQGYSAGSGAIRMVVDAREAQVYVDGAYAGIVDEFDGTFQKLYLQPGEHEIELRLDGHRTFSQRVLVSPRHTQNLHHQMVPLGPEDTDAEPTAVPAAEPSPTMASEEFGILSLRVQPAVGEIWIDGERWGTLDGMDAISIHLPAGMHRVDLRREGSSVFSLDVEIRPGDATPLNVRLPR